MPVYRRIAVAFLLFTTICGSLFISLPYQQVAHADLFTNYLPAIFRQSQLQPTSPTPPVSTTPTPTVTSTPSPTTTPPPTSSGGTSPNILIDADVAAGKISPETGLVYKVFAIFGDPRLPSQYQVTGDFKFGDETMIELVDTFDSLSPETRDILRPFTLEPNDPNSWYMNRPVQPSSIAAAADVVWFGEITAANGKVKVIYASDVPDGLAKAQAVVSAIDGRIWPKLVEVMGKEPEFPAGGAIKVFLINPKYIDSKLGSAYGVAIPDHIPPPTSGIIQMNALESIGDDNTPGLVQSVAHEMMHIFQFAFPEKDGNWDEYLWLYEAVAMWTENLTYPHANSEWPYAPPFLETPQLSIENKWDQRYYGAYFLPMLISNTPMRDDKRIGQIFNNIGTMNSSEAVEEVAITIPYFNTGIPSLSKAWFWSKFYRMLWNQKSTDPLRIWDQFTDGASLMSNDPFASPPFGPIPVRLNGGQVRAYEISGDIDHSSSHYFHFTFPDDEVRSVYLWDGNGMNLTTSTNWIGEPGSEGTVGYVPVTPPASVLDPYRGMTRGSSFWVLYKTADHDWREYPSGPGNSYPLISFSRDEKDERITDLVVILGNTDVTRNYVLFPPGVNPPTLWVSNVATWKWTGTVNATQKFVPDYLSGVTSSTQTHLTLFQPPMPPDVDIQPKLGPIVPFSIQIDSINWSMSGQDQDGCTYSDNGGGSAIPSGYVPTGVDFDVVTGSVTGPWHRGYFLSSPLTIDLTGQVTCPGLEPNNEAFNVTLFETGEPGATTVSKVNDDGTSFSGTATTDDGRLTYEWSFTAQREP